VSFHNFDMWIARQPPTGFWNSNVRSTPG